MDAYWILEYIKVFGSYIFLMFIWPTVVFGNYLKKKTAIFHFCFCVTVQVVIINMMILIMGLFNILNRVLVSCLFYGVFAVILCWKSKVVICRMLPESRETETKLSIYIIRKISGKIREFWNKIRPGIAEYIILAIIIAFGMAYFSYGLFQMYSYGQYDMMRHHIWVNSLIKGEIFSDGIYPMGMHCFIYTLNALFGIRAYSIMLFLQCIHTAVFLLSAYSLLREVFSWRYTPVLVLALYLTMDADFTWSMSRLQQTLPMEFGLHTQFICALCLIRYLKKSKHIVIRGKNSKCCWDENLILFIMALATSLVTHYHTTIMAFVLCASFALFNIKKIVCPRYLIPLTASVLCGCMIAAIPVTGALASGIPFEGSIDWGLKVINSSKSNKDEGAGNEELQINNESEQIRGPMDPTAEDWQVIEKLPPLGQKVMIHVIKAERFIREIYDKGYKKMYWDGRGERIFWITAAIAVFCLINGRRKKDFIRKIVKEYPPLILISFLSPVIYAAYNAPELGLMIFIPNQRFASSGHMITLAVLMIPADIMFSCAVRFLSDHILQVISAVCAAGIYVGTNLFGIFHEYLYCVLAQYNSAVLVTNSIIEQYPQNSYTIVSPVEEFCEVELYGKHEEISVFFEKMEEEHYSLSTEYVFIYVEKKPLGYRQVYYYNGPSWLAKSKNSEIKAAEISHEAAQKDWRLTKDSWESRIILESKAYEWCREFESLYPGELKVYYEDEDLVCYYFQQNADSPYNLVLE